MIVKDLIDFLQREVEEDYEIAFSYCHTDDEMFIRDEWEYIHDIIVDEIDYENGIVYLGL